MIYAFDASALIAFANAEPGSGLVKTLFADSANMCLAHAANLCEFYYDMYRRSGDVIAKAAVSDFTREGLCLRSDMDVDFWQAAGRLKARVKRISLEDCFGLTLAARTGAEFVTAGRHELERLTGEFRIRFIR